MAKTITVEMPAGIPMMDLMELAEKNGLKVQGSGGTITMTRRESDPFSLQKRPRQGAPLGKPGASRIEKLSLAVGEVNKFGGRGV